MTVLVTCIATFSLPLLMFPMDLWKRAGFVLSLSTHYNDWSIYEYIVLSCFCCQDCSYSSLIEGTLRSFVYPNFCAERADDSAILNVEFFVVSVI